MKVALCILTLNEIDCLKIVFPMLPPAGESSGFDSIYAIDGGSTDGTLEFFNQNGIKVIGQSRRGRGEAFKMAFELIKADAFIFFSPDGNEDIKDLPRFKRELSAGYELVIASRMMTGSYNEEDISWWRPRKWANLAFNYFANLFFNKSGRYVTDSINGYRAITKKAAKKLNLSASDYTIEYQMTIKALKFGLKIAEFPTLEGQRVAGASGILSLPAGLRFIRRLFSELAEGSL